MMIKNFKSNRTHYSLMFTLLCVLAGLSTLVQPSSATTTSKPSSAPIISPITSPTTTVTKSQLVSLKDFIDQAQQQLAQTVLVGAHWGETKVQVPRHKTDFSYGDFLSQLKVNGFTAYRVQDYIQVVPLDEIRYSAVPVLQPGQTYFDDEYVTDTLHLKKACSNSLLPTLRPMVPKQSHLALYQNQRLMIITDTYANIQRIKAMIKGIEATMDKPESCNQPK